VAGTAPPGVPTAKASAECAVSSRVAGGCPSGRGVMELGRLTVLLLEPDGTVRAALKSALEELSTGVISARSAARALEFCKTAHLRFGALVVGPSLLDASLDTSLLRILSVRKELRVLALIAASLVPPDGSRMPPLAVCWALERLGCSYSLLDEPWTGARLRECLQELLGRSFEPAA
jgi:CheY-like chemotaxis protein